MTHASRAHAEGMQEVLNHPALAKILRTTLAYGMLHNSGLEYKPEAKPMNIHDMLTAYQRINEFRLTKPHPLFPPVHQVIEPPETSLCSKIPTLQRGHYRKITPYLRARFEYAGSWKEAEAGHEWLGLSQMEAALQTPDILEQIRVRPEIWTESPLVQMPPSRISLFGLYPGQYEEIYLIWPLDDDDDSEPEILSYAGNFECRFSDFAQYLNHLMEGES